MKLRDEYSFNFLKDLKTGTITPSALSKVYVRMPAAGNVTLYDTARQALLKLFNLYF